MNIILLSGGSGKRLWPLSNEVRSKQFLKLFRRPDGKYESMVQRVWRQIRSADPDASVTIATSKTQVSAIHNQLGGDVKICVEPMRRDTFPAIVLACAYLHDEEKVPEDEPVVICPVDPYVEDSYFETLKRLSGIAGERPSGIALMGIEPTYPSEKYGYIIPCSKDELSDVREFREKPDRAAAEKYLSEGALWNAGVFAMKISYLLKRAHEMIDFIDYRDLYGKYSTLPKISFDYAVVEKEPDIGVLRYRDAWKDVGTWNMMSEVMSDPAIGNVTIDGSSSGVNAVNELEIPILIMGAHNMVVAASGDGILVSDKEQSGYMKPYVEKISTDIRYAEKSWGSYQVIDAGPGYLNVKVTLRAGSRMSYHSHEFRNEIWTALQGRGRTVIDGMEQELRPGDVVTMAAGCRHTVIAETNLTLLETQLGDTILEKDKTKYEFQDPGSRPESETPDEDERN